MSCSECIYFRPGIFVDFCALKGVYLFKWCPCPDFRDSISCYKVNKNVNGKGEPICDI